MLDFIRLGCGILKLNMLSCLTEDFSLGKSKAYSYPSIYDLAEVSVQGRLSDKSQKVGMMTTDILSEQSLSTYHCPL